MDKSNTTTEDLILCIEARVLFFVAHNNCPPNAVSSGLQSTLASKIDAELDYGHVIGYIHQNNQTMNLNEHDAKSSFGDYLLWKVEFDLKDFDIGSEKPKIVYKGYTYTRRGKVYRCPTCKWHFVH